MDPPGGKSTPRMAGLPPPSRERAKSGGNMPGKIPEADRALGVGRLAAMYLRGGAPPPELLKGIRTRVTAAEERSRRRSGSAIGAAKEASDGEISAGAGTFQCRAIPLGEIRGRFICTLQEIQQHRIRRRGG